MLVYISAPYTHIEDKVALMAALMKAAGSYMVANPGSHVVSPLYNHFALPLVPALGKDWAFWSSYSIDMLRRCDMLLVLQYDTWMMSTGVKEEIALANQLKLPIKYILPS